MGGPYAQDLQDRVLAAYDRGMKTMDIAAFRKLVALDEQDPLSRFARALFQEDNFDLLEEACEHLTFANQHAPEHLASYHLLGQVLIQLSRKEEARSVLTAGCAKTRGIGEGMGRDLGPAMEELLGAL